MSGVFLKILNISIMAGWLILAVILIRLLFKKAPKWLTCLLWGLVALRLLLPQNKKADTPLSDGRSAQGTLQRMVRKMVL